ncbi:MAG: hemolysin III family protein [Proteobacteria bacterium]|nr:hemolysin III family protein [Pseudomonadota bacterium]MDA1351577.1 hemolysin III family protein [Pseudomonadota bacterium]
MYYGERLNSISHLVGSALALVGLGSLMTVSISIADPWVITSFTVFGLSLVLMYTMSTLYHSFRPTNLKRLFQLFDHISIYLLIAGTYTPFMLVSLRDGSGWLIMVVIWALALVGILSEIFLSGRLVKVSQMVIYFSMGWACALDFSSLKLALDVTGFQWLVAGGVAYTVGAAFYILDKVTNLKHAHGVWHFAVLSGSVCHFVSIVGYVR